MYIYIILLIVHISYLSNLSAACATINKTSNSPTPLFYASNNGSIDEVKKILENGIDIEFENQNRSFHSLIGAAYAGHANIIQLLIQAGINPNIQDENGQTALFLATVKNHKSTVKTLLELGADPKIPSRKQNTALHIAAHSNYVDILKLLLIAGADINCKNTKQETALDLAKKQKHEEIINILTAANIEPDKADLDDASIDTDIEFVQGDVDSFFDESECVFVLNDETQNTK